MSDLAIQIVAFGLGIVASSVSWLLIQHALRPKIELSEFISKRKAEYSKVFDSEYLIKVANMRRRPATNVMIRCYLRVKGVSAGLPDISTNFLIPVHNESREIPLVKSSWAFRFQLDEFEDAIRSVNGSTKDPLEELMVLGQSRTTTIRVVLTYADSYSGISRTTFRDYSSNEIDLRYFQRGKSLSPDGPQVKPGVNRKPAAS